MRDMAYLDTALGADVADHLNWCRLGRLSPVTLDAKERILARLAVDVPADVGVAELAYEHLERYFIARVPEGSWRTHRSHIKKFVWWAIKFNRRTAKNPVDDLPQLRPNPQRVITVYDDRERELILDATRYMDDPARDLVRAYLLFDAGIRKAEARGVQNHRVDPSRRQVTVIGKNNKERVVPVRGDFWIAWESHLLTPYPKLGRLPAPDDYVWFPARVAGAYKGRARQITAEYPERPMVPRGYHDWWVRLIEHTNVEYRKPHTTRHTYGTDAVDASKGDIYGVQQLLGHASIKTTEIYLHSSTKRKESVVDELARSRRQTS